MLGSPVKSELDLEQLQTWPGQAPELAQARTTRLAPLVLVGLVLLGIVAAWTLDSILHPAITGTDLNLVATMVAKDMNPGLYPRDDMFADAARYRFYTPFYRWLVARLWQASGSFEGALIYLTPIALLLYLPGMFILLWRITGHTWLALGVTVASAGYYEAMGEELWGVGGSHYLMSRAIFTAVAPYLFLMVLIFLDRPGWWQAVLLGLAIGLSSNLHPISGWQFAALAFGSLGLIYGLRRPGGWRSWLTLVTMTPAVVLGASPIMLSVGGNVGGGNSTKVSFEVFSRIIDEKYSIPFRPSRVPWPLAGLELQRPVLDGLVWLYVGLVLVALLVFLWGRTRGDSAVARWGWLIGSLVVLAYAYLVALFNLTPFFILAGGYVVYRFRYWPARRLDWFLVVWLGLTVLCSFVGYYLLMLAWRTFQLDLFISLFTGQVRAARFVYLPLYALVGLAALAWVKTWTAALPRIWGRWGLVGRPPGEVSLSLAVAGLLALGPGLSGAFFTRLPAALLVSLAAVVGVVLAAAILERLPGPVPRLWHVTLGGLGLALVLFGPLASPLALYLPVPAVNLLNPAARAAEPVWPQPDQELYVWTRKNTSPTAFFYWCEFGPLTTLNFRRLAGRSINVNWKDLNLVIFKRADLYFFHSRYRELEAACGQINRLVAMARTIRADYILVPAAWATNIEHESCFLNERYAVFPVNGRCGRQ